MNDPMQPARADTLANILRVLSMRGRDALMETAFRLYMQEQRITEDDIRRLPLLPSVTQAQVDAAFGRAARIDEATRRNNERNEKISRSMTLRWGHRKAKADPGFQRFLQHSTASEDGPVGPLHREGRKRRK